MKSPLERLRRAWLEGAGVIFLIVMGDLLLRYLGYEKSWWLLYAVWGLFMAAVFATTYRAPFYKFILGVSHSITIAVLFTITSYLQTRFGLHVSIGKEHGFGTVFALIYVSAFIPAVVAAAVALLYSMNQARPPHQP